MSPAAGSTSAHGHALIHIGLPKTGSTSIQIALMRSAINSSLGSVRYPLPADRNGINHNQLALCYFENFASIPWVRARFPADHARLSEKLRKYHRRLFEQLHDAPAAIISAESFSHFSYDAPLAEDDFQLSTDETSRFRQDLADAGFDDFRIVLYVRDPADHYLSTIGQRLLGAAEILNPIAYRCPFRRAAEVWEEVFPGCLIIRLFTTDPEFDVVQDFSAITGEYLGVTLPPTRTRANTSLSAEGLEILQRYRSLLPAESTGILTPDVTRLVEFLRHSDIPQTKPRLRPEISAWIRANHRDDITFIADHYGLDMHVECPNANPPPDLNRNDLKATDILQNLNPETVTELLLQLAQHELNTQPPKRPLPIRAAQRLLPHRAKRRLKRWRQVLG